MTKSTTDIPILDDGAVAEIETRYQKATLGPWEQRFAGNVGYTVWATAMSRTGSMQIAAFGHAEGFDRDNAEFTAHAREDIPALCATVRVMRKSFEISEANRADDARVHREIRRDLQSQLEQVTKERDEEKRLRAELKQIAQAGIAEVSSVGTALGEIALTDFRSRAIALCRNKAAKYKALANDSLPNDQTGARLAASARTLEEFAAELEGLK